MRKILIFLSLSVFLLFLASCVNPQTQITIKFNTNGGNVIEDMIVSSTSSSVNLPTPVKEGSTFDGWFTDSEFNSPFTIGALLTNTQLTLFAKWTENVNQVTVTFEVNGGTAISAVNVAVGGTITAPTAPTKTGFTFDGWFSDSALTTSFVFTTTISSNITLYAKWTPVVTTITVTFDVDGGTSVASQTINSGSKATLPTTPTKVGYTFAGWYVDSANTVVFDFDTNLSTNTTIYAKWNINSYTVNFDSTGGSIVPPQTINHGATATLPTAPTKTGYTFGGWYSDSAKTVVFDFDTLITVNTTIYAKWTINTYTVTFDVDGGSSVTAQVVDYNQKATLPTAPTKTGYTFGGWYTTSALTTVFDFDTLITVNTTIYAKWTINTYTVTFDVDGGNSVTAQVIDYNQKATLPTAPTKTGYTFGGWYSDSTKTVVFDFETLITVNTTIYAKWTLESRSITFVLNNGEANIVVTQEIGTLILFPDNPTKLGYTFDAWYKDSVFIQKFNDTLMPSVNTTLYARFVINNYVISFEENGGSDVENIVAPYQASISAPTKPYREFFTFDGWYIDPELTISYQFTTMPLGGITLYAKWIDGTEVQTIASILLYGEPGDGIYVSGVVYDKLYPNPMVIGFYIYDGTGSLFIKSDQQMYEIGDEVTISGAYSLTAGVPQIEDVYLITDNFETGIYDLPVIEEVSIYDITQENPNNLFAYGRLVELTGVLRMMPGGRFYLFDLTESNGVEINYKSYPMNPSNPLLPFVDQLVTMNAVTHLYVPMDSTWHILYHDEITPIQAAALTDQQIVDQIVALGQQFLTGMEFPSGSNFMLPTEDLPIGASIEFSTTGVNADKYDVLTGDFAEVEDRTAVTISFTVTLNEASATGEAIIYILPVIYTPIGDLYTSPLSSIYYVQGVVVFMAPDQNVVILADDTGFIIAMMLDIVELGDEIKLMGHLVKEDGPMMLVGPHGAELIEIVSHDNEIPIPHIDLTIAQMLALDPTNNQLTGLFIETKGFLHSSDEFGKMGIGPQIFILEDEFENMIPVMAFDMNSALLLESFAGQYVFVRGFLSPTGNPEMPFALIFNGRTDGIGSGLTPTEYLNYIMSQILFSYDTAIVRQLATLPNILNNLPIGMTGTLTLDPLSEPYFNLVTYQFADVTEMTVVQFEITLYYQDESLTDVLTITIDPIETSTILEFLLGDSETIYYVRGIVTNIAGEGFVILADETSQLFILKDIDVKIGDEIIISGKPVEFFPGFIVMDDDETTNLEEIVSVGLPNPSTAFSTTIEAVNALDFTDASNIGKYIEVRGRLTDVSDGLMGIALTDGEHTLSIGAFEYRAFETLMDYGGLEVYLRGYLLPNFGGDPDAIDRFLFFNNQPGDLRVAYETDLEKIDALLAMAVYFFDGSVVRPGDYFYVPTEFPLFNAMIDWEAVGPNAIYFDSEEYQFLYPSEETNITFTVTVTIGEESNSIEITLILRPFVPLTIEEALFAENEEDILVQGIVVFISNDFMIIADDYGYLFVQGYFEVVVELGDLVQVRGYKRVVNLTHQLLSYGSDVIVVSSGHEFAELPTPYEIDQVFTIDFTDPLQAMKYVELTGTITRDDYFYHEFVITDGVYPILLRYDYTEESYLSQLIGSTVTIRGFIYYNTYYSGDDTEFMNIIIVEMDAPEIIEGSIAEFIAGPLDAIYYLDLYMFAISDDLNYVYFSDLTGVIAMIDNTFDFEEIGSLGYMHQIIATKTVVDGIAYISPTAIFNYSWWNWFGNSSPERVTKSIEEIATIDLSVQSTYLNTYRIIGIVANVGDTYYLTLNEYSVALQINDSDMQSSIANAVGELFGLDVYIEHDQPVGTLEHVTLLPLQSGYYPNLTSIQQIQFLQSYITSKLDGASYFSLQTIELPYYLYGTGDIVIEYSVDPEDEVWIDLDYETLSEVTEPIELTIHVRLETFYNPSEFVTFDVTITINPVVITPIATLIADESSTLFFVKGNVVGINYVDQSMLIYDGTDFLFIWDEIIIQYVNIGNEITLRGAHVYKDYKHGIDDVVMMVSVESWSDYEFDGFPLTTMEDLFLNDPTDASFYGTTIALHGSIRLIESNYNYVLNLYALEDEFGNLVYFTSSGVNNMFADIVGYEVDANVIVYGYRDGMWVVHPDSYYLKEYTAIEKMAIIKQETPLLYQDQLFRPDEIYYLQNFHKIFWGVSITWSVVLEDQVYASVDEYNALTFTSITENTSIQLIATITISTVGDPLEDTVIVPIVVRPLVIIDGDQFLLVDEDEWVTMEVVVLLNAHSYMIVAEVETGLILYAEYGDWIGYDGMYMILTAQKKIIDGKHILAWGGFVEDYLGYLDPYEFIPTILTVEELGDEFIPAYYYTVVQVTGTLTKDASPYGLYQIKDSGFTIYLTTKYGFSEPALEYMIGDVITIDCVVLTYTTEHTLVLYPYLYLSNLK